MNTYILLQLEWNINFSPRIAEGRVKTNVSGAMDGRVQYGRKGLPHQLAAARRWGARAQHMLIGKVKEKGITDD
jgi:hypothetical protein